MILQYNGFSLIRNFSKFVPKHDPVDDISRKNFIGFLSHYNKILVLTGAGVSTESGIPDYRSEDVGLFSRKSYKPILFTEFMKNRDNRLRYWARNYVGWPQFSSLVPNKIHYFFNTLQGLDKVTGIITQNVDGLHFKANNKDIIELHGNAFWVKCMTCNKLISRNDFQTILSNLNLDWTASVDEVRPDGDVEIDPEKAKDFVVPDCEECGGILKPTVVFFGENVPPKRVKQVEKLVEECDSMLIMGTSLSTLSSYRIVTQAYDLNKFICIVNIGETRADKMADLLVRGNCSDVLPAIRT